MRICTREGSVSASRDFLNLISIAFFDAAYHYESKGLMRLATSYREIATQIYDRLDETGYYGKKESEQWTE